MLNIDDRILDRLNESETFLCLQILRYMKPERMTAWPSMETLCKACGWEERKVKRVRKSLHEKGVLSIVDQPGKPCLYSFDVAGFGVFIGEPPTFNGGTKMVGGTKNGGTILVVEGVPKRPPEEINKEEINNSIVDLKPNEKIEIENPKPAESKTDVERVESEIFSWANSTGAASIQNRYQQAKKQFSESEFQAEVIGFCGWYLTRVDEQITARFKKDPPGFFYANLHSWLNNPNKRKPAVTQNQTQYNGNRNANPQPQPQSRFNSDETIARAARIVARLQADGM